MNLKFTTQLSKKSKILLVGLLLLLSLLVWAFDYLTGPALSSSILYLLIIAIATWFVDRTAGLFFSLLSTLLWLSNDMVTNPLYSDNWVLFWNTLVRLVTFLIVTFAFSALRTSRERQQELVSFVVHDLRAPLSNILSGFELWQENVEDQDDTTRLELMDIIQSSADQMLYLINSLLDLSRIENKKMPIVPTSTVPGDLIQSAIEQLAFLATRREVEFQVQIEPETPPVWADPEITVRILVNLMNNAIRFSPAGTPVQIRVQADSNESVRFHVIDQGPGIPREWRTLVFDKFTQVQARKAGASVGSGLGLAFCKLAVEAQNGRIWLEQGVERGTVAVFTLPSTARHVKVQPHSRPGPGSHAP